MEFEIYFGVKHTPTLKVKGTQDELMSNGEMIKKMKEMFDKLFVTGDVDGASGLDWTIPHSTDNEFFSESFE